MGISTKGEAAGVLATVESSKTDQRNRSKGKKKRKIIMGVKSATPGAAKKRRVSLDTSSKFNPDLESQKKSDTDAVSSSTKQKELSSRMRGGVKGD